MFKRMYFLLFNRITDAIKALDRDCSEQAREILIRAQQDTERLYVEWTEETEK